MKKLLSALLILFSFIAMADSVVRDGIVWTYTVVSGKARIDDVGTAISGDLTIPTILGGYNVNVIGSNAFSSCTGLTSVTIPEGVTSIGNYAFQGCSSLTSVTIPSSVTSIGMSAFSGCKAIRELTILPIEYEYSVDSTSFESLQLNRLTAAYVPSSIKITTGALIIPEGTTKIPDYAFKTVDGFTSVIIPEGVTSIGYEAFAYCYSLKSVTFPSNSITIYGCTTRTNSYGSTYSIEGTFYNCTSLNSLHNFGGQVGFGLDNTPKYHTVFSGCTSFPTDENGRYGNLERTILLEAYMTNGQYVIPDTVQVIAPYAFLINKETLTSVTIPSSVTSIGNNAFYGCAGLTAVRISDLIAWCGIEFGYTDANPLYYAKKLYLNGKLVKDLVIPSNMTSISAYAFYNCDSLTSVHISDLEAWCKIRFGNAYANPLYYAKKLYLNGNLVEELNIPSSVTSIGKSTFEGCSSLTSVTIPEGVTSIGNYAFKGCAGLTAVTIPESVTSIGSGTFWNCSNLTSVTIPNGVTTIGDYAFRNCVSLTSVTIPASVTSIGTTNYSYSYVFDGCVSLTSVLFKGNPPNAASNAFPSCDGYYPSTKATEWSKVIKSGLWNNLRMIAYQSVTLSFNANGGTGGGSDEYIVGMSLQAPTVSREGYTFKGWSPSVPSVVPETTTTYTAQWQVNQYRMTFNANGGTGGQTLTLDYGSRVTAPTVTREGYTFNGWSPEVPSTMPATNTSYTAQWRINQYTQTFDANGGEGGTSVTQDYGSTLIASTVTREGGYIFVGWLPEVPETVPAENVTYVAQWEIQAPSWETPDNYQNNMTIYAQVKDTTKDALIESAGSLLAAFDSNGQCRGVASITTGPTGKLYQLTVCSNTAAGEALTLKIWNASTGETIDIGESVAFVSDGKIGSLPAPKVYTVGQIALDVQLKTGWNWFSVNVELPRGTTLSEVFKDWTPCDEDVIKSATSTATYYDGVWYPEDFALEPGKMYQIKNSVTDPVTIRLMGAPVPSTTEIAVKAGWNWLGYTGTSAVDVAIAFSADTVFTDEDLLKSGTASATYYGGQWWGDLKLEPGKGYKLQAANATTVKYASATPAAAPVALLSVGANPNWVADERQYNMTVYASVKDAAGRAFEAAGSWLGAFDTNGICHGSVALGNGPRGKLYQLTPGSDTASGEVFTLKLWDAASGQIYDIEQTITFVSDGTVGSIINPQVYTVVETAVKFDVAANVIGDGTVTGAGAYEAGETVVLTATPAEGYVFCGWSTTPVSMEATHSFTMPEEAVTLTAYFAPAAALNNYIAGQGFVSADEVEAKIQEYIADNNLKTPEEVEAAIEAHIASNGLLTPAQANQQTQDYIVANKLKSEQEVAVAIAQAIEEYVSSNGLLTPAEAEQLVKDYIADNKLMSKDEAKQELLDADEVFTADEMKALVLGAPVIQVKDGKATVSIQVQRASELDGEWEVVEDGEVSVEITPKAGEKAAFYKFVVPNEQ